MNQTDTQTTTCTAPGPTLSEALGKPPSLAESQTYTAAAIPLNPNPADIPRDIVGELIREGERCVLGSTSKSGKSWAQLHLAVAKSQGLPWLGWNPKPGPVLYIDLELLRYFFDRRMSAISAALGVSHPKDLHLWSLRAVRPRVTMRQLVDEVCKRYQGAGLDLVILEPSYKLVTPGTQGTNGEYTVLEYLEALDEISHELKCGVMTSHHSPKGDLSARSSIDLFSGSGTWARDPDVLMTLRPHQKDGFTILQTTRRHGEPKDDVVLRWDYPLHQLALDEDPSAIRNSKTKSAEDTQAKVVELLAAAGDDGWCSKQWLAACEAKGISAATYYRAIKPAKLSGTIQVIVGDDGKSRYRLPPRPF